MMAGFKVYSCNCVNICFIYFETGLSDAHKSDTINWCKSDAPYSMLWSRDLTVSWSKHKEQNKQKWLINGKNIFTENTGASQ